jgi:hypothetical protein
VKLYQMPIRIDLKLLLPVLLSSLADLKCLKEHRS